MRRAALLAMTALLYGGIATAEESRPADATDLLFETPQWADARPGDTLAYRYSRKSANEGLFGPSFDDRIRLHVDRGATEDTRTVRVELFGAERRRASGPFEDVSFNPVLMLFLEHHVEHLSRSVQANPRYLKNAIRAALRDGFKLARGEASVGGRPVTTWQVVITPFLNDPNKARMKGLQDLVYTLAVSEQVPGQITELTAKAARPDGVSALEETLVYDPNSD
jgi:hypothetical protein